MLSLLLLGKACSAQRLSLTTGFNSFILRTAAVLAYGLEKKLVEELVKVPQDLGIRLEREVKSPSHFSSPAG